MKMASKRFVKFTEEEIASFTEDQENANTKKKTVSDLKLFNEFLNSEEEERNIENDSSRGAPTVGKEVCTRSKKEKWRGI